MVAADDSISAELLSNGKYRWCFVSPGGATHYGPRKYARADAALAAGRRWLDKQQSGT